MCGPGWNAAVEAMFSTRPSRAPPFGNTNRVSCASATTLTLQQREFLLRRVCVEFAVEAEAGVVDQHIDGQIGIAYCVVQLLCCAGNAGRRRMRARLLRSAAAVRRPVVATVVRLRATRIRL